MLSTRLLLLSTLGLGLTAWSGAASAEQAVEPTPPVVEVLHVGALPHEAVRVAMPDLGDRFELVVVTHRRWAIARHGADRTLQAEVPVEIRFSGHVVAVDRESGLWTEELVLQSAGVLRGSTSFPAEQVAASEGRLEGILGVRLVRQLDRRGGQRALSWTDGQGADAERYRFLDTLDAVQCPLPADPIGIGARWRVEDVVELPPVAGTAVHAQRTRTFQLVDGGADSVRCVQLMEQGSGQVLTADGSGRITLTGKGAGRVATARAGALHGSGVHTLHVLASTERIADGGAMDLEQVIDVTVDRRPLAREQK